ncbi:MAG: hypothetical protein RIS94_2990 [Pseudomonadota bacterium]|jgi:hypothetical protein
MKPWIATLGVALAAAVTPAHAEDQTSQDQTTQDQTGVVFAGGSAGSGESAYGGVVVALPGGRLGKGLAVRVSGNAGTYRYTAGVTPIKGRYVGGDAAIVYQMSGPWGWNNLSIGPRITDTKLTPGDPGNRRTGTRVDVGLQADGALDGAQWRLGWFGAWGVRDQAYQARFQIGRKLPNRYRIGVEGGVLGDSSFDRQSAGAFVAVPMGKSAELQLAGGALFQKGRSAHAYAGLSLSSTF